MKERAFQGDFFKAFLEVRALITHFRSAIGRILNSAWTEMETLDSANPALQDTAEG